MRILMLPRFGRRGANSRYRLWQYRPLLESAGHHVDVLPMLDDHYLDLLYTRGVRPLRSVVYGYLRHLSRLFIVRNYDTVLLDQELLPYLPPLFECIGCRLNPNFIVDYDDAAYMKYQSKALLRDRIGTIMRAARAVVVGNRHLEEYARRYSKHVHVIPTVVDVTKYKIRDHRAESGTIRIGWIGTPVTAKQYLPAIMPVLAELQAQFSSLRVRLIGAGKIPVADSSRVEFVDWSEDTEAESLSQCDIGIMPLPDCEFQKAKCGLKLVQFMAAGLPVVASPVGENQFIVAHGRNGFHATDAKQWTEALGMLIRDSELRARMGAAGRKKAEQQYSLEYGFHLWNVVLQALQC